jgi:ABC-2 type transport system permease protein
MLGNIEVSDLSFLIIGYIGLMLNLASFLVLGLLSSSLSGNQVISALSGFVTILFIWIIGWFGQLAGNYFSSKILNFLSVNYHFTHFLKGMFSLSDLSFYLCFILFFLLLTKKRLEMRLW